jgi:hypothetical protein
VYTRTRHWTYTEPVKFDSHTYIGQNVLLLFNLLFFHLHLRLPSNVLTSRFAIIILYVFPIFPMRATCSAHVILIDFIALILTDEE